MHFLNYWQLLKQKTKVSNVKVSGLDTDIDYTDANFVDNIKNYMSNAFSSPYNSKKTIQPNFE